MFTTAVAWVAFVLLSLIFVALLYNGLRSKTDLELLIEKVEAARQGYSTKTDWKKVGGASVLAIWFAAGWYLFG